jgi:hypothetical protein
MLQENTVIFCFGLRTGFQESSIKVKQRFNVVTDRYEFEDRGELFEVCIRLFGQKGKPLPFLPKYM